eukprot:156990-Rhodomonas_salina.3
MRRRYEGACWRPHTGPPRPELLLLLPLLLPLLLLLLLLVRPAARKPAAAAGRAARREEEEACSKPCPPTPHRPRASHLAPVCLRLLECVT